MFSRRVSPLIAVTAVSIVQAKWVGVVIGEFVENMLKHLFA